MTDFKPLPTPHAVTSNSPEGVKTVACCKAFEALATLAGLQTLANAFAYYMAQFSVAVGMPDENFAEAMSEFAHIANFNRANLQSARAKEAGQKTS